MMNRFKLGQLSAGALLSIALTSALVAPVRAEDMPKGCEHQHWEGEHGRAFFEQHQNELHDKLVLTAKQESAWKVFIEKTKPIEHTEDMHPQSDSAKLKAPERMDLMLSKMKAHEQQMQARVQATKEFYSQLTPAQQTIFDESFPHKRREHKHA